MAGMQQTVVELTAKLSAAEHMLASIPPTIPALLEVDQSRFPIWTTAFLSLVVVVALVSVSIGYWMMARN